MYEKAYIMMYIRYEIYRDCGSEKFLWLMVTQAKKSRYRYELNCTRNLEKKLKIVLNPCLPLRPGNFTSRLLGLPQDRQVLLC
jgi:hypothetical protein